ncbi:MAG TPA: DUF1289 domain-containing protein [Burkholderiales bacterium]|nr:DUF1289 domain-containing protein [Burkholderiales bacterium]
MKSPCVKVCLMDPHRDLCRGCHRTLDEIARWASMCEEERERVLAALPARRAASDVAEVPVPPLA